MKEYNVISVTRTARARSQRLRESGVGGSGGTSVNVTGGTSSSGSTGDGHTHANLSTLNRISVDADNYMRVQNSTLGDEGEIIITQDKIKAGFSDEATHADMAHDLDDDSPVYDEFLRKDIPDTAAEVITFLKGLKSGGLANLDKGATFGEFIDSMIAGKGAAIDENGRMQAESIEVRSYLKVLELVYNRLSALEGDYSFTDFGTIDSIEDLGEKTYRLTMRKRWDTDFTSLHENDVVYGIVNSLANGTGASVYTSWLRVLSVNTTDNTVTVLMYDDDQVPAGANFPPTVSMNVTRKGNSDSPTDGTHNGRQDSWLLSSTDGQILFLENVYKPILDQYNYALSIGKLPALDIFKNLPVGPDDMCVYSKNIIAQNYYKIDSNGLVSTDEVFRGEWSPSAAVSTPYRRIVKEVTTGTGTQVNVLEVHTVYHLGCKWACLVDKTVDEPKWNSTGWQFLQGDNQYAIDFISSNGMAFFYGKVDSVVTAKIYFGSTDITDQVMALSATDVQWTRDTGSIPDDNAWIPNMGEKNNILNLHTEDMGINWLTNRKATFTCRIYIPIGEFTITESLSVNI